MDAAATVRARRGRIFYGWIIVAAGMGIQALQGALLGRAYGVYVVLLQAEYGWSKTVFSIAYSLQQIESGLLGPAQGWLLDRFGPKATMRVGIVMFGGGFLLFSRISSVTTFYIAFVLMAIGSSLGGFMPITVTIVNWFNRRRASAMGIFQTGAGIGGLLLPVVAWVLNAWGWRPSAFASGILIMVVGLPLVQLMRHKPESYGILPDGDVPGQSSSDAGMAKGKVTAKAPAEPNFTAKQALRTAAFWCVALGHGSSLLVVSSVQVHMVPHLHESLGYSLSKAAAMVTVLTLMTMIGQVGGGFLGDRFSKRLLVIICMLGHAFALITLAFATNIWMVILFTIVHGLAWGVRGPLMAAIRADYFGRSSFGTISGFSSLILTLGTVSGPIVAGAMADHFGNYKGGFTVLAVLAGLGSVFWIFARPPRWPDAPVTRTPSVPITSRAEARGT